MRVWGYGASQISLGVSEWLFLLHTNKACISVCVSVGVFLFSFLSVCVSLSLSVSLPLCLVVCLSVSVNLWVYLGVYEYGCRGREFCLILWLVEWLSLLHVYVWVCVCVLVSDHVCVSRYGYLFVNAGAFGRCCNFPPRMIFSMFTRFRGKKVKFHSSKYSVDHFPFKVIKFINHIFLL